MQRDPRVAIIGAGMSGLCVGSKLKQVGVHDITLYEKAAALGGTWRENTYPGVACDVPSFRYQFSFTPNPNWSHALSPGAEIAEYLRRVSDEQGLTEHIRYDTELTRSQYVDGRWHLFTAAGKVGEADFLISATGILHHPKLPDIDGLSDFAGPAFHSARWDHSTNLAGRRVAIIGNGSTGAQIIAALAPEVAQLTVFQRTAQWMLPIVNPALTGPAQIVSKIPGVGALGRAFGDQMYSIFMEAATHDGWQRRLVNLCVRANLRTVRDRELRAKLTPDDKPLCRRMVMSTGFYQAVQRSNVDVVTDPITGIDVGGVRTADGVLHKCDVLVFATGFDAHAYIRPMQLIGRDGITLDEAWANGPHGYKTVAQPGFPNYFTIMGPHSPVGNFSLTAIAETQADYVVRWIQRWREGRFDTVEPTAAASEEFNTAVRQAAKNTIWATGCKGWYLGPDGLPELWPWHPNKHAELLARDDLHEFRLTTTPLAAAKT